MSASSIGHEQHLICACFLFKYHELQTESELPFTSEVEDWGVEEGGQEGAG